MRYRIVKNTLENGDVRYAVEERCDFLWWHWWSVAKIECLEYERTAVFGELYQAKESIHSRLIGEVNKEIVYEI